MKEIWLSPSQVMTADRCRRMHWYRSIAKVRAEGLPANLAFGRCIDLAVRDYLSALTLGGPLPDPVARFLELWRGQTRGSELVFAATKAPEDFERSGCDLMKVFPEVWTSTGLTVATDTDGKPLVGLRLRMVVGCRHGIKLRFSGEIDLVAYTPAMALGVVDAKTSQAVHTHLHTRRSDQLTGYQLLFEANRRQLGLPGLSALGFMDFIKRQKSSTVEPPVLVPPRSAAELDEYRDKLFWMADDIARGRFPRASRMLFDSPCEACDFSVHCVDGDTEGLVFPDKSTRSAV